ncbi:MAG TPA: hypothetical protein VGB91_08440 [Rhizomicrobium sp.]
MGHTNFILAPRPVCGFNTEKSGIWPADRKAGAGFAGPSRKTMAGGDVDLEETRFRFLSKWLTMFEARLPTAAPLLIVSSRRRVDGECDVG